MILLMVSLVSADTDKAEVTVIEKEPVSEHIPKAKSTIEFFENLRKQKAEKIEKPS